MELLHQQEKKQISCGVKNKCAAELAAYSNVLKAAVQKQDIMRIQFNLFIQRLKVLYIVR